MADMDFPMGRKVVTRTIKYVLRAHELLTGLKEKDDFESISIVVNGKEVDHFTKSDDWIRFEITVKEE